MADQIDPNVILKDPDYLNANAATKAAIFEKHVGSDADFMSANDATKAAIRQKWGIEKAAEAAQAPKPADKPAEKGYTEKVGDAAKDLKGAVKKASLIDTIKGDAEVAAHIVTSTVAPIGAAIGAGVGAIKDILKTEKGSITVRRPDGTVEKVTGDRNWRNNNPGNIEYGEYAKSLGAIGTDGRFAVFPDYNAGRKAQEKLIFEGKGYAGKNLSAAIGRYAPDSENDTGAYVKAVLAAVGGKNKVMSEYTPEERVKILDAMQKVEGFKAGKTEKAPEGFWQRYDAGKAALTYQPKTEVGKAEAKTVGAVLAPVGEAIGAVKGVAAKGLEAVGFDKETAQHIPDVIEDFIPFKGGKIAKIGVAGAEATAKTGLAVGRKAVETVTSEVPMAARGKLQPTFIEGSQQAFAQADELGVKLTQAQVKAEGLRAAGKTTEATKVLEKEAKLAERESAVADHYTQQSITVAKKLEELANPKTINEAVKLTTPAERQVLKQLSGAIERDAAGNVTRVNAKKLNQILEKNTGKLSEQTLESLKPLLDTARAIGYNAKDVAPRTLMGELKQGATYLMKHKAETAAYAALGITNPMALAAVGIARYLGGRGVDKLNARRFSKTEKLRELGAPSPAGQ